MYLSKKVPYLSSFREIQTDPVCILICYNNTANKYSPVGPGEAIQYEPPQQWSLNQAKIWKNFASIIPYQSHNRYITLLGQYSNGLQLQNSRLMAIRYPCYNSFLDAGLNMTNIITIQVPLMCSSASS